MIHGPTKVITSDTDLLKKYDLAYSDILLLNECGLINVNSSNMHFDISTDNSSILFTNEKLILVKGSCIEQKRVIFGVYSLTQAGKELHSILIQKSDSNYIFDFGLLITQKNAAQSPIVSIHEVIEVKNDNVEYIEEPLNIF
ncbi:hypothetical protein SDC9_205347 [bioreactor metagenome]|uniref:Uncharacterized protein n=1 Tax=bioreactor metagenome TaxID=1076179 RepID=A0A645JDL5_9ZZZZ